MKEIRIKAKAFYFADPMLSAMDETLEDEWNDYKIELERQGIYFDNLECVDIPPFDEDYQFLFFDCGGMSGGNTFIYSFCRKIIEQAKECPNKYFIMVSKFTQLAMKESMEKFGGEGLNNIYHGIQNFCSEYRKYN